MSKTITLSVSDELYKDMQRFREINYSELARENISKYLEKAKGIQSLDSDEFLKYLDLIFNKERIIEIHGKIESNKESMQDLFWVQTTFDLDILSTLTNFLHLFPRIHPFEDGNKRTALICIDAFLRLNKFKLKLEAFKDKTSEDEKFFWQNSNQQKTKKEINEFLQKHLIPVKKPKSVEEAINDSIKENKQLLENLAK